MTTLRYRFINCSRYTTLSLGVDSRGGFTCLWGVLDLLFCCEPKITEKKVPVRNNNNNNLTATMSDFTELAVGERLVWLALGNRWNPTPE